MGVTVFGGSTGTLSLDLGYLSQYIKLRIKGSWF